MWWNKCSDPNSFPSPNHQPLLSSLPWNAFGKASISVFSLPLPHKIGPDWGLHLQHESCLKNIYFFLSPINVFDGNICVFSLSTSLTAVFQSNKATCLKGMKQYCSFPFFTCQRNPLGVNFLSLHLHMTDFQGWIKSRSSGSKGWRMHVNSWRCGAFLNLWCFFLPPSNCVR